MRACGLSLPLSVILGALLAWGGAAVCAADDANLGGYANPEPGSHFLGTVTIENAAMLDATGKPYDPSFEGANVHYHSTLYRLLAHTYLEQGRKITFKTDAASEVKYRNAIRQYPHFPFGYYALALTLRRRGDPAWRVYAQNAVALFEKTTAIGGCNPAHFAALKGMQEALGGGPP
jgi:hypothetical protein